MQDIDRITALKLFQELWLIRRFDEIALELQIAGRHESRVHPYSGQEAIAVGVCAALRRDDRVVSNHRGHGHCIAKGADVGAMMAEIFGRRGGSCGGKGGTQHIADFQVGLLGANGIVAAGLPIAAGSALAARLSASDVVTVCFFGDGAVGAGSFHETLNLAVLWRLPLILVCENNQYSSDTPVGQSFSSPSLATFASSYGLHAATVDGNDVEAVLDASTSSVARAREGLGGSFIECVTFRIGPHVQRVPPEADLRDPGEIAGWTARDPVQMFERKLLTRGDATPGDLDSIRLQVERIVLDAVAFAEGSPFPGPDAALTDLFAD